MKRARMLCSLVAGILCQPLLAQPPQGRAGPEPLGLPPCETFIPNVQGGGQATVAVVHASDGLLYALTEEDVLSYDGARWKRHELPGVRTWSSLADRPQGGVYVGGDEEIGALCPGPEGSLVFRSLLEGYPEERRGLQVISHLIFHQRQIFFSDGCRVGRILLADGGKKATSLDLRGNPSQKTLDAGAHYLVAASRTGMPYVVVRGRGICRWTRRGLDLIPGGDRFKNIAVLALADIQGRLLVVGQYRNLSWLEDGEVRPFDRGMPEGRGYLGHTGFCRIPGIGFAITTSRMGVQIYGEGGQLLWQLDSSQGLGTDSITHAPAPDRQGGLWIPMDSGLIRVALRSPLQIFDSYMGLQGEIRDSCWHQGQWYVATSTGIFVYQQPKRIGRPGSFTRADRWALQMRQLSSDGENLLVSSDNGLMSVRVEATGLLPSRLSQVSHCVYLLSRDRQRLWVGGLHAGVEEFAREGQGWKRARRVLPADGTPHGLVEAEDGSVYALVHLHDEGPRLQVLEITGPRPVAVWSIEPGSPPALSDLHLYTWEGKAWFRRDKQLFQLTDRRALAVGFRSLSPMEGIKVAEILQPLARSAGRFWFRSIQHEYACLKQQNDLTWAYWNPFQGIPGGQPTWFDVSADGRQAWMGNRKGRIAVYREIDPATIPSSRSSVSIAPMIQDLAFLDGSGYFSGNGGRVPRLPALPRARSAFRIRYSLPAFDGTWHRLYQSRLLGLEEHWSTWRRTPFREFSSLPAGRYRFEVRALDAEGRMSATEGMDLVVLEPWYATVWAILAYVVLAAGVVWGLIRARTSVAKKRIRRLEEEIRNREIAEREQARLEEQLRQAQRLESLGRMAGGVAHDFNNILTAILGHAELVREDAAPGRTMDERTFASVEEIMKSGRRAADLTHRLLAFSRKQVLHPRVLEINEILDGLKMMLSRLLRDDIDLQMELDPRAGRVRVDPGQIEQVILNLVLNACDAMPDGGTLEVWTRAELARREDAPFGTVKISVRDNGTGIEAGNLEEIFEPFYTTKPVGQGTGLGLSSALGIVKQSGGTLEVSSEPGAGTLFEITFPRLEAGRTPPLPREDQVRGGSGERILLVDDDESVRSISRILLTTKGYRIEEAADSEAALRLLQSEEDWDVLITDMVMPGMNGRDLARSVRDRLPGLPVLFLSGYSSDLADGSDLGAGESAFLQKPFHSKSLLAAVRELLDRASMPSE